MTALQAGCLLGIFLPFGVAGYYLSWVAEFYRLKFGKGPSHTRMRWGLAALILGLALLPLNLALFPSAPSWPSLLAAAGGLVFIRYVYLLYRAMMSAD